MRLRGSEPDLYETSCAIPRPACLPAGSPIIQLEQHDPSIPAARAGARPGVGGGGPAALCFGGRDGRGAGGRDFGGPGGNAELEYRIHCLIEPTG